MKKIFFKEIFLSLIFTFTLFIGLNNVKADTIDYEYFSYSSIYSDDYIANTFELAIPRLVEYWREYLQQDFPYYYIGIDDAVVVPSRARVMLHYSNSSDFGGRLISSDWLSGHVNSGGYMEGTLYTFAWCTSESNVTCNDEVHNVIPTSSVNLPYYPPFSVRPNRVTQQGYLNIYGAFNYYTSNFTALYNGSDDLVVTKDNNTFLTISSGGTIPTFKSILGISNESTFTEVNLNNYKYVVLSLKDYTPRDTFSTTIYALGEFCPTAVYDYGMKEKKDFYNGFQTQACSEQYFSFTPVSFYVLSQDISNNAVYYIKANNLVYENKIKFDPTIFDITYITSENEDNPSVDINGRSYPIIPFSDLTDTANNSTDEGYISGQVCAIGDINCQGSSVGLDMSDLFSNPLNLLEEVWDSITSVFGVITAFLGVLPPILQAFLYTSFMLALVIGIIKIIL